MAWTYRGNDALTRAASALYGARQNSCALAPFVFMTDPKRVTDIAAAALCLPRGGAVIYRHFGAPDKQALAKQLRDICCGNDMQFLISDDEELADTVGAHGVHLPERSLAKAEALRLSHPHWVLTGSAHSQQALQEAERMQLDAVFLSPVFATKSPGVGRALGVKKLAQWVGAVDIPVFALGGIHEGNAEKLLGTGVAGIGGVSAFSSAKPVIKLDASWADKMTDLHRQCFTPSWPKTDFTAHIDNEFDAVLGIVDTGNLQGFIIVRTGGDQAEILTMAVAKEHRRQNLGRALLLGAQASVRNRGADIMFLEVARDNVAATALYEGFGYIRFGTRPGYYRRERGRVDAYLYQKHI